MAGGADSRRTVHIQADVVILLKDSLAGVNAHAYAHIHSFGPGVGNKCPLSRDRGGDRVARAGKRDEEGVALGVDLATVVLVERRAQHALMLAEHVGVASA